MIQRKERVAPGRRPRQGGAAHPVLPPPTPRLAAAVRGADGWGAGAANLHPPGADARRPGTDNRPGPDAASLPARGAHAPGADTANARSSAAGTTNASVSRTRFTDACAPNARALDVHGSDPGAASVALRGAGALDADTCAARASATHAAKRQATGAAWWRWPRNARTPADRAANAGHQPAHATQVRSLDACAPGRSARVSLRLAALPLGLLLLGAGAARADLALCNGSEAPIRLAGASTEYEGGLSSRGLGDVEPGRCATLDFNPTLQPPYYYRVASPAFSGADREFCVEDAAYFYFDATGACPAGGHLAGFRLLEPPPGATRVVVNLGAAGEVLPAPALPQIDLAQPFVPPAPPPAAERPATEPPSGPPLLDGWLGARLIPGGIPAGSLGESYDFAGVWDGCATAPDPACTFFSEGWRFQASAAGGTPAAFLDRLRTIPRGTVVTATADLLGQQPDRAEVALSQVRIAADSPFLGLFWALQGRWQALDGGGGDLDIDGSQITGLSDSMQRAYLLLQPGCAESGAANSGAAPALVLFSVPDYQRQCLFLERLSADELVLRGEDGAGQLRFRRP